MPVHTKTGGQTVKATPSLAPMASSELGDDGLGLAQTWQSGRPMRRKPRTSLASPFVDSAIVLGESEGEDDLKYDSDEIHFKPRPRKRKRSPSPPVEPASQMPASSDSEQDKVPSAPDAATRSAVQQATLHNAFQINISNLTVVVPAGHVGPIMLQIDPSSCNTLPRPAAPPARGRKIIRSANTSSKTLSKAIQHETDELGPTGFMDLPAELRNVIYRLTFVTDRRLDFGSPSDFGRGAALLRTCKQVHEEGRGILYSENSFHFARRTSRYGSFWEDDWRELGFRAVQAFVKTIGPVNLSFIRNASLQLEDATPCLNPGTMTHDERRFVNDDVLMSALRHLGDYSKLENFDLCFHGRRRVERSDGRFLEYLQRIRADRVRFLKYPICMIESKWTQDSKQADSVRTILLKAMIRKKKMYPIKD